MNHFGACEVFTVVTARTHRYPPNRGIFLKCFRPFVASWPAPSASGRSESGRVGIAPTERVHLPQGTHNMFHEREAESKTAVLAARGGVSLTKTIEDVWEEARSYADPRIGHGDFDL